MSATNTKRKGEKGKTQSENDSIYLPLWSPDDDVQASCERNQWFTSSNGWCQGDSTFWQCQIAVLWDLWVSVTLEK